MVVEVAKEKLVMQQRPYLENKLKRRGLMAPNFGKESLPEPREGHYLPEDKDTPQYKEELKQAQTEVGSCSGWHGRPDQTLHVWWQEQQAPKQSNPQRPTYCW
eukprot:6163721-Prorocentrum_lima.AAC.1